MRLFKKKIFCQNCDQQFSRDIELMQHQQIVHGKELPYDCKICNQNFTNMQDMRTHLQKFHSYRKD
ncbi:MAG: C2H2-type zinc finger protein [Candidatus Nitrosotenuis sp.]